MTRIRFELRYPNGKRETINVEGARVLIGSGSHCDVRLPMEDAAFEHVVIETAGATLRAEARAEEPPATIDDMPLTLAPLARGTQLGVGRVKLIVDAIGESSGPEALRTERGRSSPIAAVALMAAFAGVASLLLLEDDGGISPPPAEAPALFTSAPQSCPPGDRGRALGLAEEQLAVAEGKRERMPFAIEDGVEAVSFYRTAAACFRQGGLDARAVEADEAAAGLERDLTDEQRTRALRLMHLLAVQDYELARGDVAVLRALSSGKQGRYIDWLATVSKQLSKKGVR